jgi:hypothetical protein
MRSVTTKLTPKPIAFGRAGFVDCESGWNEVKIDEALRVFALPQLKFDLAVWHIKERTEGILVARQLVNLSIATVKA